MGGQIKEEFGVRLSNIKIKNRCENIHNYNNHCIIVSGLSSKNLTAATIISGASKDSKNTTIIILRMKDFPW